MHFSEKTTGILRFVTLPLEIPEKNKPPPLGILQNFLKTPR